MSFSSWSWMVYSKDLGQKQTDYNNNKVNCIKKNKNDDSLNDEWQEHYIHLEVNFSE